MKDQADMFPVSNLQSSRMLRLILRENGRRLSGSAEKMGILLPEGGQKKDFQVFIPFSRSLSQRVSNQLTVPVDFTSAASLTYSNPLPQRPLFGSRLSWSSVRMTAGEKHSKWSPYLHSFQPLLSANVWRDVDGCLHHCQGASPGLGEQEFPQRTPACMGVHTPSSG